MYGYDAELNLIDIGEGEASYQLREDPENYVIIGRIKCLGLNSILKKYFNLGVDIIKMDIEGSEKSCLENSNNNWLRQTKILMVEIHESFIPGLTNEIINKLGARYTHFVKGEYNVFKNTLK